MASPLGKYSQPVAAIVAVMVIGTVLVLRIIGSVTGTNLSTPLLDDLALIAVGAVFGSAATTQVNGNAINAAHNRLDQIQAPPSKDRDSDGITH